jgi:hypothetical protein
MKSFLSGCFVAMLPFFFTSCSHKPHPVEIFEFTNSEEICNYSKSFLLSLNKPDQNKNVSVLGFREDLFFYGEFLFQLEDTSTTRRFSVEYNDSIMYLNGKAASIALKGKNQSTLFLKDLKDKDLSTNLTIGFDGKIPESAWPDLKEIAVVRPGAGLVCNVEFKEMQGLFRLFHPRRILAPVIFSSDYGSLAGLTDLQLLFYTPGDSANISPLPALPKLDILYLSDIDEKAILPGDLLKNNRQISKLGLQRSGSIDLALLEPLENLKELVIRDADTLLNLDRINQHTGLEVLSLQGKDLKFDPALIRVPGLRWISLPSSVTQEAFNRLCETHPNLEVVELIRNDTISDLRQLAKLSKLSGLMVMDTVTDVATVRGLKNLKFLSLPENLLNDSLKTAVWKAALPGTTIVANEGFCLGSGWLLLLIPLVIVFAVATRLSRKHAFLR